MMKDFNTSLPIIVTLIDVDTRTFISTQEQKLETRVTAFDNHLGTSTSISQDKSYLKSYNDIRKSPLYIQILKQLKKDDPNEGLLVSPNLINEAFTKNSLYFVLIMEEMFKNESTSILEALLKSIIFSDINIFQDWFKQILKKLSSSDNKILKFKAESLRSLYKDYFLSE